MLLVCAEQVLGRNQLEDVDTVELPAMRRSAGAQLIIRLGERDIEAALAGCRACHQELLGDRRLAGAGVSLHQEGAATGQPTIQYVVEPD